MSLLISKLFVVVCLLGLSNSQDNFEFKPVKELPSDIPTCSQKDANLSECLKSLFQQMIPRIKAGIPELNIPPLDPFVIPRSTYQYSQGAVQGRISVRDVSVYGLSAIDVKDIDMQLKDNKMKMKMTTYMPSIYVEGDYKANMKINDLKLNPKGRFNVSMAEVTMVAQPEGELVERDGHSYLHLSKFGIMPELGDMKMYASGLVEDPALNTVILDFVNENWRQLYKTMLPETRQTWEPILLNATNRFFAALPIDLVLTKE